MYLKRKEFVLLTFEIRTEYFEVWPENEAATTIQFRQLKRCQWEEYIETLIQEILYVQNDNIWVIQDYNQNKMIIFQRFNCFNKIPVRST